MYSKTHRRDSERMVHLPSATIRRERCICNIEVVDEVFVFAALRHPGFSTCP